MRRLFVSSALLLLALSPAAAQSMQKPHNAPPSIGNRGFAVPGMKAQAPGNRGTAVPETKEQAPGAPAPHQANLPDEVFVVRATRGGAAEIELARLAEQKTRSGPVREFAQQMIKDHSQANDALGKLAEEDGVPAPDQLDAEHRHVRNGLLSLSGPEFDIEYLRMQVQNHQRMAQLLEYEIGSGKDAQIRDFASGALPKVFVHLAMARDLLDQVSRQNPQVAAEPPRKVSGMPMPQTPRPLAD
jgi:putative membrane protein